VRDRGKKAECAREPVSEMPTFRNIKHGFVYERIPRIALKSIATNEKIDEIYQRLHPAVTSALSNLNDDLRDHPKPFTVQLGRRKGTDIDFTLPNGNLVQLPSGKVIAANELQEWEVPRNDPNDWTRSAIASLSRFWEAKIKLQQEIDKCIATSAEFELRFDKPFEDKKKVRVSGPFTVESLSPHRSLVVNEENDFSVASSHVEAENHSRQTFIEMILDILRPAGVQQVNRNDRI